MSKIEALLRDIQERQRKLTFIESSHKYFVDDVELTSVTTFLSQFFGKFNAKGAAFGTAKAINKEFEALVNHEKPTKEAMPKTHRLFEGSTISECRVRYKKAKRGRRAITPEEVQKAWKSKGKKASEHGTEVHLALENYILNKPLAPFRDARSEAKYLQGKRYIDGLLSAGCKIYPEVKVYSKAKGVAGTMDLLVIDQDGLVSIEDWKTNKAIEKTGYNNKKASAPINHLQDCNYVKYGLQMQVYGKILEDDYGFPVHLYKILHLDGGEYVDIIPAEEYKKEVKDIFGN